MKEKNDLLIITFLFAIFLLSLLHSININKLTNSFKEYSINAVYILNGIANILSNTSLQLSYVEIDAVSIKIKIDKIEERIKSIENEIKNIKWKLNAEQPSYYDIIDFLMKDSTDKLIYVKENNKFICTDFANNLIANMKNVGIDACLTILYFSKPENTSHAIVAVKTEDLGVIFIEPQSDKVIFDLRVGEDYCKKVNWNCEWIISNIKSCYHIGG